jgi:hypothetical protein
LFVPVFGGLAFLIPLTIYCLILAMLNARRHPTVVSGPWDFAGALFATSGFLLVGGPWVLATLNADWRSALAQGRWTQLKGAEADWSFLWAYVGAVYFLAVIGGAAFLLRRRRLVSAVYNVEPAALDHGLTLAFDRLGLACARVGNRLFVDALDASVGVSSEAIRLGPGGANTGLPDETAAAVGTGHRAFEAGESEPGRKAELEVDYFPLMRHATLRWHQYNDALRRDVEAELAKALAEVETRENPVAGWFLSAAACLFLIMFFGLVFLIALQWWARR